MVSHSCKSFPNHYPRNAMISFPSWHCVPWSPQPMPKDQLSLDFKYMPCLTSTQKPRFDNKTQFGGRAFALVQLFCVVPTHTAFRGTASHQYNLALSVSCCCYHFWKYFFVVFVVLSTTAWANCFLWCSSWLQINNIITKQKRKTKDEKRRRYVSASRIKGVSEATCCKRRDENSWIGANRRILWQRSEASLKVGTPSNSGSTAKKRDSIGFLLTLSTLIKLYVCTYI